MSIQVEAPACAKALRLEKHGSFENRTKTKENLVTGGKVS